MIGKGAFQETDVFGLALPIVKHSYLVMNVEDIPRVVKEAFYIANTGRPGPVWIDIPKDVQQSMCKAVVSLADKDQFARVQPRQEDQRHRGQ